MPMPRSPARQGGQRKIDPVFSGSQSVDRQRIWSATASAQTALSGIQIKDRGHVGHEFMGMFSCIKILCREMRCIEFNSRRAGYSQAGSAFVPEFQPPDIGMMTVFLGHEVGHVFVRNCAFIHSDLLGGLAVTIVFPRAAAEVAQRLEPLG